MNSKSASDERHAAPPGTEADFARATALVRQGTFGEAAEIYRDIVKRDPDAAPVWANLSLALQGLKQFQASVAAARRAVELAPANPLFLTVYANALGGLDRMDEAVQAHAEAAARAPGSYYAHLCHGHGLRDAARYEEAIAAYDKAIALQPDDAEARWWRRESMLNLGLLPEGWKDRELRYRRGIEAPKYNSPRWQGEGLSGKTIMLYPEEGHGDNILCSRYVPLVKQRGGRVLMLVRKPLQRLFQNLPGVDRFVEPGHLGEAFHFHCPLLSLPGVFGTVLETIPAPAPLWIPPSPPPAALRKLEQGRGQFRVGIVWSGNTAFPGNDKRAVRAERFLPLAEVEGVQLYSLQKGEPERQLADCGATGIIAELGPHLEDYADTAAVLQHLDLIIMTDSSVAHLAGTMGKPVWNLLNVNPYWLYLTKRNNTPWYPSMRLFRQPEPGEWDSVFRDVKAELEKTVGLKKRA